MPRVSPTVAQALMTSNRLSVMPTGLVAVRRKVSARTVPILTSTIAVAFIICSALIERL